MYVKNILKCVDLVKNVRYFEKNLYWIELFLSLMYFEKDF